MYSYMSECRIKNLLLVPSPYFFPNSEFLVSEIFGSSKFLQYVTLPVSFQKGAFWKV